jgi:hypothetical protein
MSRAGLCQPVQATEGGHRAAAGKLKGAFRKCELVFGVHPLGCPFLRSSRSSHFPKAPLDLAKRCSVSTPFRVSVPWKLTKLSFSESASRACQALFGVQPFRVSVPRPFLSCNRRSAPAVLGSYAFMGQWYS